jgi:hypothetical protein
MKRLTTAQRSMLRGRWANYLSMIALMGAAILLSGPSCNQTPPPKITSRPVFSSADPALSFPECPQRVSISVPGNPNVDICFVQSQDGTHASSPIPGASQMECRAPSNLYVGPFDTTSAPVTISAVALGKGVGRTASSESVTLCQLQAPVISPRGQTAACPFTVEVRDSGVSYPSAEFCVNTNGSPASPPNNCSFFLGPAPGPNPISLLVNRDTTISAQTSVPGTIFAASATESYHCSP